MPPIREQSEVLPPVERTDAEQGSERAGTQDQVDSAHLLGDGHAVDPPEERPGVPMEAEPGHPSGVHWREPTRQKGAHLVLHRMEVEEPTPVFGTAQPPHGLSGALRHRAYRIPERFARHWLLLLAADRVDVLEDRVGSAMAKPLERLGMSGASRQARRNPLPMAAGLAAGAWIAGLAYRVARGRSG